VPSFIDDATTLPVEHVLGLGKHLADRTHSLVEGDILEGPKHGVPQDNLRLHGAIVVGRFCGETCAPDGPAELAGSSVATSSVVTLVAPLGSTSEAGDPPPAATCAVAPMTSAAPVIRTPPPPTTSSLGWASTVSCGSATWVAPVTLGPPKGGDLSKNGTLYVGETKLKSQTRYKKWQIKGRIVYRGFQEPWNHHLARGVEPLGAAALLTLVNGAGARNHRITFGLLCRVL
jgi:hypothetical protein